MGNGDRPAQAETHNEQPAPDAVADAVARARVAIAEIEARHAADEAREDTTASEWLAARNREQDEAHSDDGFSA